MDGDDLCKIICIRIPKITLDTKYLLEFNTTSYSKSILSTVYVYKNSPEFKVTVTPKELNLNETVQISITSSIKGAFRIYVNDGEEKYVELVKGRASKIITGFSVGVHKINIKFINEY